MEKAIKIFFLATTLLLVSMKLSARSIRWADTGEEFVREISENLYEPASSGIVSYKLENGEFWQLFSGKSIHDKPKGYIRTAENMIYYYDSNHDLVACYVPAEKRFYMTTAQGDVIIKKTEYALLFNGGIYSGGENNNLRFLVDNDFPLEWLGFFLIIY